MAGLRSAATAGGIARLATVLGSAANLVLITRATSKELYGVFTVIGSVQAITPLLELGVGLGVVQALSASTPGLVRREIIADGFIAIGSMVVAAWVLAILFVSWADMARLLGIDGVIPDREINTALIVLVTGLSLQLLFGLAFKIMLGVGSATMASVWQVISVAATVLVVAVTVTQGPVGLVAVTTAMFVTPAGVALVALLHLFARRRDLLPCRPSARHLRSLFSQGLAFTTGGVALTLTLQSTTVVVAHMLGPEAAAEFGVAYRLSGIAYLIVQGAVLPIWPHFAQLLRERLPVARLLSRTRVICLAAGLTTSAVVVVAGDEIISLWAGAEYEPSTALLSSLAVLNLVQILALADGYLTMADGGARFLARCQTLLLIVAVPASVFACSLIGLAGPAFAVSITYAGLVLAPVVHRGRRTAARVNHPTAVP